jgi:hypothetical protein
MKTILSRGSSLLLLIAATISFIALSGTYPWAPRGHATSEEVDVSFGRGPLCDGPRGLCKIEGDENSRSSSTGDAPAEFIIEKDGSIKMRIPKSGITVMDAQTQFVGGTFKQEEDLVLSSNLSASLRLPQSFVLKKGQYPVEEDSTHFVINFSSSQKLEER